MTVVLDDAFRRSLTRWPYHCSHSQVNLDV